MENKIILYTSKNGDISINPLMKDDSFWLSQIELANLFGKGRTTITEHIQNIFTDEELEKGEVSFNVGNSDNSVGKGKTLYNLDMIISVGYRVNSKEATQFRIWATKTLKEHITGNFKSELMLKKQASELFAREKNTRSLEGILGNIFQTYSGKDVYSSLEEKAAHFLYFIVKNHPFTDGNKRTGAFCFLWFLSKVGYKFEGSITPPALTAITLLVADSNPNDKQRIVGLIMLLLKK